MTRFDLVFDNSGDAVTFQTVHNHDLFEFFVDLANQHNNNNFSDEGFVARHSDRLLNDINFALSKTNEILFDLYGQSFPQNDNKLDYFDQDFLNRQHELWVVSQNHCVDIDQLRFSTNKNQARLGNQLHDLYPDNIRQVRLAEAMIKLGYILPYEEVNMTVHALEKFFAKNIEFKASAKWQVFDNPFYETMTTTNDAVNLSFGYTYVGRQYYNKWSFFDTDLKYQDHYNYETLEWAFQINLQRPETRPYSKEFLHWCHEKQVRPITNQLPIANIVDLEKNLTHIRTILYKNSRAGNSAKLVLR
jgi:hypothetical protein